MMNNVGWLAVGVCANVPEAVSHNPNEKRKSSLIDFIGRACVPGFNRQFFFFSI